MKAYQIFRLHDTANGFGLAVNSEEIASSVCFTPSSIRHSLALSRAGKINMRWDTSMGI
jgi:hypothetical protein